MRFNVEAMNVAVVVDTRFNLITVFDQDMNSHIDIKLNKNADIYITDKDGEHHLVSDLVTKGVLS